MNSNLNLLLCEFPCLFSISLLTHGPVESISMTQNLASKRRTNQKLRYIDQSSYSPWLTISQRSNEQLLREMVEGCKNDRGTFGTMAAALDYLSVPEVKTSRPYSNYKGRLTLGDLEKYPQTALFIDVERYFRTHLAKPISATSHTITSGVNGASQNVDTDMPDAPDISGVKTTRKYQVNDPEGEGAGGKKEVFMDELARGYEYGRTAVHLSESDGNVTSLETKASFEIIGFIPSENVRDNDISSRSPADFDSIKLFSTLVKVISSSQQRRTKRLGLHSKLPSYPSTTELNHLLRTGIPPLGRKN